MDEPTAVVRSARMINEGLGTFRRNVSDVRCDKAVQIVWYFQGQATRAVRAAASGNGIKNTRPYSVELVCEGKRNDHAQDTVKAQLAGRNVSGRIVYYDADAKETVTLMIRAQPLERVIDLVNGCVGDEHKINFDEVASSLDTAIEQSKRSSKLTWKW